MTTRVLGVGGSNHDFSACLVEDGRVVVAIEDERIQRVKHGKTDWHARPGLASATYCLEERGIKITEVDLVAINDDLEQPGNWIDVPNLVVVNHHTAHAAAAFYTKPLREAAVMVIDGHGSVLEETNEAWNVETVTIGRATSTGLDLEPHQLGRQKRTSSSWRHVTDNSIGWLYEIVSDAIGFKAGGQGKTMGLAAHGTSRFEPELRSFCEIGADGTFRFDPYGGIWDWLVDCIRNAGNQMQVRADLAAAVQSVFSEAVVAVANEAHRRTELSALVYGGGCSLNTVANSRVLNETTFDSLDMFPAAGDNGLAVGAALYGYYEVLGGPRSMPPEDWRGRAVYLGREYGEDEMEHAITTRSVSASRPDNLMGVVARRVAAGDVVALYQGGSELGPRALGHRSLIASPQNSRMRDHINLNVKHRESFRPLAPAVPLEFVGDYFEGPEESPYMQFVYSVREEWRDRLAAVTHVDGTARVQTVRHEDNPFFHSLLVASGEVSGCPILINTSLNGPGQPIVETPTDAIDLFLERPIDLLVLGDLLVEKFTPWTTDPDCL